MFLLRWVQNRETHWNWHHTIFVIYFIHWCIENRSYSNFFSNKSIMSWVFNVLHQDEFKMMEHECYQNTACLFACTPGKFRLISIITQHDLYCYWLIYLSRSLELLIARQSGLMFKTIYYKNYSLVTFTMFKSMSKTQNNSRSNLQIN